jgi:stress-induced morphogen
MDRPIHDPCQTLTRAGSALQPNVIQEHNPEAIQAGGKKAHSHYEVQIHGASFRGLLHIQQRDMDAVLSRLHGIPAIESILKTSTPLDMDAIMDSTGHGHWPSPVRSTRPADWPQRPVRHRPLCEATFMNRTSEFSGWPGAGRRHLGCSHSPPRSGFSHSGYTAPDSPAGKGAASEWP